MRQHRFRKYETSYFTVTLTSSAGFMCVYMCIPGMCVHVHVNMPTIAHMRLFAAFGAKLRQHRL